MDSYPIFFYAGIIYFLLHLMIYGLGLDQSYYGLILVYVGYIKPVLSTWIFVLLWIGLVLEGLHLGKTIYDRLFGANNKQKGKPKKPKHENQ